MEVVFASHNRGKINEMRRLLAELGLDCVGGAELGLSAPEEVFETFAENAALKAQAAFDASGRMSIGDDSGLVVPSIGGAPGLHTARWAGPAGEYGAAMERLEGLLGGRPPKDREAELACALYIVGPGLRAGAEARLPGTLVWPPQGEGPGFEPMFVPAGQVQTLAQLGGERRLALHPRRSALAQLVPALTRALAGR